MTNIMTDDGAALDAGNAECAEIVSGHRPVVRWHELQLALTADTATLVVNDQRSVMDGAVPLAEMGCPDNTGDCVRAAGGCDSALAFEQGSVPDVTDGRRRIPSGRRLVEGHYLGAGLGGPFYEFDNRLCVLLYRAVLAMVELTDGHGNGSTCRHLDG